MIVKFITLGCKTNLYESEAMAELFRKDGFDIVSSSEIADIYIINTCTVTGIGAQKSRQHIHRAKKENPNAIIAVTGCYAQTEPEKVSKMENVDIVLGNNNKSHIVDAVREALNGKKINDCPDILRDHRFDELGATVQQSRIRANIKIEDGCSNFCTYCIIPYARGPVRSRELNKILDEAEVLSHHGFAEVVLTGIHIDSYGKDFGGKPALIDVLEGIDKIDRISRIRLGSLEPISITDDFVKRAKKLKKLCPQFHLALQSGCDETLKRMNRHYDTEQFRNAVNALRDNIPDTSITTDLMVGFAGETDEEFQKSYEFCKEIGFMQMHIFKYSIRNGTKASTMPNQVDEHTKEIRSHKMLGLAEEMKKKFYSKYTGKTVPVLVETKTKKGLYHATTANYMDVYLDTDEKNVGEIIEVTL